MKRFFRWLIGYEPPLCQKECKWEIYETHPIFQTNFGARSRIGFIYLNRCQTCGLLTQERVEG